MPVRWRARPGRRVCGKETRAMVRSFWKRAYVLTLAGAVLGLGQPWLSAVAQVPSANSPARAERYLTVQEVGKAGLRCKLLRAWRQADGSRAYDVQAVETGERLTIAETGPATTVSNSPVGKPVQAVATRIYHWGNSPTRPAEAPSPPNETPPVSAVAGMPQPIVKPAVTSPAQPSPEKPASPTVSRPIIATAADPAPQPAHSIVRELSKAPELSPNRTSNTEQPSKVVTGKQNTEQATAPGWSSLPVLPPRTETVKGLQPAPTTVPATSALRKPKAEQVTVAPEKVPQPKPVITQTKAPTPTPQAVAQMKHPAPASLNSNNSSVTKSAKAIAQPGSPVTTPASTPSSVAARPVTASQTAGSDKQTANRSTQSQPVVGTDTSVAKKKPLLDKIREPAQPVTKAQSTSVVVKPPVTPTPPSVADVKLSRPAALASAPMADSSQVAPVGGIQSKPAPSSSQAASPLVGRRASPLSNQASEPKTLSVVKSEEVRQSGSSTGWKIPELSVSGSSNQAESQPVPVVSGPAVSDKSRSPVMSKNSTSPATTAATGPIRVPLGMGSVVAASFADEPNAVSAQPRSGLSRPTTATVSSRPVSNAFTASTPGMTAANAFSTPTPMPVVPASMPASAAAAPGSLTRPVAGPDRVSVDSQKAVAQVAYANDRRPPVAISPGKYPFPDQTSSPDQLVSSLREALAPSQREWAAEGLAKVNWRQHPQVVPTLLAGAREDPAQPVRLACIKALVKLKANTPEVLTVIEALKTDSDPQVRQEAEQALSLLKSVGIRKG